MSDGIRRDLTWENCSPLQRTRARAIQAYLSDKNGDTKGLINHFRAEWGVRHSTVVYYKNILATATSNHGNKNRDARRYEYSYTRLRRLIAAAQAAGDLPAWIRAEGLYCKVMGYDAFHVEAPEEQEEELTTREEIIAALVKEMPADFLREAHDRAAAAQAAKDAD